MKKLILNEKQLEILNQVLRVMREVDADIDTTRRNEFDMCDSSACIIGMCNQDMWFIENIHGVTGIAVRENGTEYDFSLRSERLIFARTRSTWDKIADILFDLTFPEYVDWIRNKSTNQHAVDFFYINIFDEDVNTEIDTPEKAIKHIEAFIVEYS